MNKYIALGGALVAAALATLAIAVWPASDTDKARDDGEQLADFRSQGPEVNRAFWDGFESGVDS